MLLHVSRLSMLKKCQNMYRYIFYLAKAKMQEIAKCIDKNRYFGIKKSTLFHFAFIRRAKSDKFNSISHCLFRVNMLCSTFLENNLM